MKKMVFLTMMLGLLAFLLCGTALTCPSPDSCPSTSYLIQYENDRIHHLTCKECRYKINESHKGGIATCTQRAICTRC